MPARKKVDRDEFARLHAEGRTQKELAEHFGVNPATLWRIQKELGLGGGHQPLPDERIQRIQQMLNDGWPWAEIGRTEGVHRETMLRYFPGTQWTRAERSQHLRSLRMARKWADQDQQSRRFGAAI